MTKRVFNNVLLFFMLLIMVLFLEAGCAVKPKFLIEQELQKEAQQEINARQEEWNWKNRNRIRQRKEAWEERVEIVPPIIGHHKKRQIMRKRQYRNTQGGLGKNTYNPNKSGQRKHLKSKKHNGVKVHKKNYWSKTTKHPQEDTK